MNIYVDKVIDMYYNEIIRRRGINMKKPKHPNRKYKVRSAFVKREVYNHGITSTISEVGAIILNSVLMACIGLTLISGGILLVNLF